MFSKKDIAFMKQAIHESQKAFENNEVPVGAVIVFENKIIGRGHNQTLKLNDPTAHAEMIAITSAANYLNDSRLKECSIYVTLEPCAMCAGAIVNAKIKNLYFGAFDPKAGACGTLFNITQSNNLNHRVKTFGGLLEDESKYLLQSFFEKLRLVN
ncbi:MAG: tRNA adenosine(34) deaminase TadA [Bacteroidetes bacterium]|nr:tRNA adenosine(34) deaminase TadA [Bacteroidota bacterium]MBU2585041.1 tRNA adenosine(34) deaminase TadA [Bacteroidota bacterium]